MAKRRKPPQRTEKFTLHAPEALKVLVSGSFTDWEKQPIPLQRDSSGTWTATVRLSPGVHEYLFIVDGQWRSDPTCLTRVPNPFGTENMTREVPPV